MEKIELNAQEKEILRLREVLKSIINVVAPNDMYAVGMSLCQDLAEDGLSARHYDISKIDAEREVFIAQG